MTELMIMIQSTLIMSISLISNNRLFQSESLVPVLTWKQQVTKYGGKEYFQYVSNFRSYYIYSFMKCGCSIYFLLNYANLICRGMDISKLFQRVLWALR